MAVTADAVRAITGSTLDDPVIEPFLYPALCLIEAASECADVSEACEEQACAFVAAHLLVLSPVGRGSATLKSEDIEGMIKFEYAQGQASGEAILSTSFGQTANMLMGGCLTGLNKRPAALFSIGSLGDAADDDF